MKIYVLILFSFLALSIQAQHENLKQDGVKVEATTEQTTCPILGGAISKNIYADYKGKRVYFCCEGCVSTFKKNPDKYISEMEAKGIKLSKTPEPKK